MFLSKRNGVYYLWYQEENGRRHKISTRSRQKKAALEFLQCFRETDHSKKPVPSPTLSEFHAQLRALLTSTHRPFTVDLYDRVWNHLLNIAGNIRLSDLVPLHFDRYKVDRLKEVSAVRVNIELRSLRASLTNAVRWRILATNPFSKIPLVGVPEKAPSAFTQGQIAVLLEAAREQWLKDVIVVALLTGMRRGELLNLRWADIDYRRRLIRIRNSGDCRTKNGKSRLIPMNPIVCSILTCPPESSPDELVFNQKGNVIPGYLVSVKLKRCVRRAGLPGDFHFHSLRHTFATWLVQAGVSLYEVQKLLGHSNISTTQIYAHLAASELHGAVNKIVLGLPPQEEPARSEPASQTAL